LLKKQRERETESNRKTEQYVYLFYVVYLFLYRRKKKKIERERERDGRQRGEGFVFLVSYLLTCYCKLFCFFYSCFGVQQVAGFCKPTLLVSLGLLAGSSLLTCVNGFMCGIFRGMTSVSNGMVRFGSVQTIKSTQFFFLLLFLTKIIQ
jgi:hypothetical protein